MTESSPTENSMPLVKQANKTNKQKMGYCLPSWLCQAIYAIKGNNSMTKKLKRKSWRMSYQEGALKSSDTRLGI